MFAVMVAGRCLGSETGRTSVEPPAVLGVGVPGTILACLHESGIPPLHLFQPYSHTSGHPHPWSPLSILCAQGTSEYVSHLDHVKYAGLSVLRWVGLFLGGGWGTLPLRVQSQHVYSDILLQRAHSCTTNMLACAQESLLVCGTGIITARNSCHTRVQK